MSRKGFYGRRMVPEYLIKKLEEGPAKLKDITNITALTDDEINTLEAGDIVLKKTSNQYHAYIVSYKEDNQGICLTYTDASCIETVSYDYTDSHWIYNSTDITSMSVLEGKQDKLTAGDGIEIDENNVISATGGGGGSQLYLHIVDLKSPVSASGSSFTERVSIMIINNSNTPLTLQTFNDYLINNGFDNNETNNYYPCSGIYDKNDSEVPLFNIQATSDGTINDYYFNNGDKDNTMYFDTDKVIQIS